MENSYRRSLVDIISAIHMVVTWYPNGKQMTMLWTRYGNHHDDIIFAIHMVVTWYPNGNHMTMLWTRYGHHKDSIILQSTW